MPTFKTAGPSGSTKKWPVSNKLQGGDFVVVYIEANDVSGIFEKMIGATGSFDTWFNEAVLKECHGMDASSPLPPNNEVLIDLL